jgi:peptide/nickel transport system permease protein
MNFYVMQRILAALPTLFIASVIVFLSVRLIPGDVIDLMLAQGSGTGSPVERELLIGALGLDKPMLTQYVDWIYGIVFQGDFGRSLWTSTPVIESLAERLPVTLQLSFMAMVISLTFAIPIGIYSAVRQDSALDYITRSVSILLLAIPSFWLGTMVMVMPSVWWGWTPETRFVPFTVDPAQNLSQLILPAFILGTAMSALVMRMTRTMMLEVLRQDYIRTAWAKGLSERKVVLRHALRNALIPVITLIGLQVPLLLSGAVILEQIFVIPGLGSLLLEAVSSRDYPIITAVFLIVGVAVVFINLLVDISYGWLDPKVRKQS